MSKEKFIEQMSEAVLQLPQDLKSILRMVEDAEIDDQSRATLAGTLLHVVSAGNAIPGVRGILQHVGEALLLRLAIEHAEKTSPDAIARHREDTPELMSTLSEELATARAYLGDGVQVLEKTIEGASKIQYKGHAAEQCVYSTDASNWLYDTVNEAILADL